MVVKYHNSVVINVFKSRNLQTDSTTTPSSIIHTQKYVFDPQPYWKFVANCQMSFFVLHYSYRGVDIILPGSPEKRRTCSDPEFSSTNQPRRLRYHPSEKIHKSTHLDVHPSVPATCSPTHKTPVYPVVIFAVHTSAMVAQYHKPAVPIQQLHHACSSIAK